MKKLLILFTATAAFSLLPSISQAACVATGEISRISVNPGGVVSSFFVRTSTPGSASVLFATTDSKVIDAALNAQASHEHVQVTGTGNASGVCGGVVGGISAGGTVTSITVAI